jgi:hypothetical protein
MHWPPAMLLVLRHQARRHPESTSALSPDYAYADAYLNANAWHSDNQKARAYQDASDDQKKHYEKCAEIRVVSGSACVRAGGLSFGGVGAAGW